MSERDSRGFRLWPFPLWVARTLSGELTGEVNPEDYGFEVIREEPRSEEETALRIGATCARVMERTGVTLKSALYMKYIDFAPAKALIAKHAELSYPYYCTFGGVDLEIDKDVFCPTLTSVSSFLLEAIGDNFRPSERTLDCFAGSGAFGIIAALRAGADVVTVDSSEVAVTCTAKNAHLNHVADRVDARQGTMQSALAPDERFDLIIANPPLLASEPVDTISAAIFDPNLQATVDFITALPAHLAEDSRCYLLTSNTLFRLGCNIEELCHDNGLWADRIAYQQHGYEDYRVHRITR